MSEFSLACFVLVTKTVAPIAAVVAAKVGGKVDAQSDGSWCCACSSDREAWCHDVVWHGVGVGVAFHSLEQQTGALAAQLAAVAAEPVMAALRAVPVVMVAAGSCR